MSNTITLPFAKSHAFIIGINAYEHVSKLGTAVQDATDIAELLKDEKKHGYETHLLTDANKEQMLAFFEEVKTTVKKKDRVIFYFAGHGIALDSEGDPEGFLVPVDAEPNDKESLIPMKILHDTLTDLPCKHGLLILDCCFAGAFKWSTGFRDTVFNFGQKLYAERFRRFVDHPAWQVITSSAHDQKASDVLNKQALGLREEEVQTESKNSPFAWALKQAIDLHSKADVSGFKKSDGVITATELYFYLREIVETATLDGMKRQSPAIFTLGKHDTKGEYIFINPGHKLNLPEAPDVNPYKGLGPYTESESDAQTFFGRDQAIQDMVAKLGHTSILVVSAPSGQGKSSVVKAGLFPAILKEGDPKPIILRPGEREFEQWESLSTLDPTVRQLILIDQYEETFSLEKKERESFEDILIDLLKKIEEADSPALKLIHTLRSDFEWQMTTSAFGQTFWQAENIRKFLYRLPPMTPEELREIMVKPAWTVAYEFESEELTNQILEEINHSPGALPLLSFTLHKLYEERNKLQRLLTERAYKEKLGGVNGALSKHADGVYEKMPSPAHQDFMQKLMLRMVRLNDGSYSRRRVYLETPSRKEGVKSIDELNYPDHLDATKDEVLALLEEALLVIRDKDTFGPYVEPMHDSLLNFWPRCLKWIEDFGRENLVLQRQLWQAVVEHHMWSKPIYATADGSPPSRPLWDNNPKLQQVQTAVTDPQDKWLCKKGWAEKSISSVSYLLWEDKPSPAQMKEMEAWNWYEPFKTDDPAERYQKIRDQMDHWLNEEELAFVKHSFEEQRSEIEQLTKERDDARATALAAKARQVFPEDPTIAFNLAYAGFHTAQNEESLSALSYVMNAAESNFYQKFTGGADARVLSVAFSRDGTQIISGASDHIIRIWSVENGKELKHFSGHTGAVSSVAFSHDGHLIVSGSHDKTIRVWAKDSATEPTILVGHQEQVNAVAISRDGTRIVSGSNDTTIRLWSVESGLEIKQFEGDFKSVSAVAFSPDGTRIVSGSDDKAIRLWSVDSDKEIQIFEGHTDTSSNDTEAEKAMIGNESVTTVAFSPDGLHILSGAREKTIRLWSIQTGKEVKRFVGHRESITAVAFSHDGKRIVSGSEGNSIRLWSVQSGKEITRLEGHTESVSSVAFSKEGKIVSGSLDRTIRCWSINPKRNISLGEDSFILSVAFSPDRTQIVSGSFDDTLRLCATDSGTLLKTFAGTAVAFSPDGKQLVSGVADGTLRLWSIASGQEMKRFQGQNEGIRLVVFSDNGSLVASVSDDNLVRLWSVESGAELKTFAGHLESINAIAFSPDNTQLLSGAMGDSLRLWSVETGLELKRFEENTKSILSLAFSPDGTQVIGGSEDAFVRLWSVKTTREIQVFQGHRGSVNSVVFSADGSKILSGSIGLRLWETASGQELLRFEGPSENVVKSVAFSPDDTEVIGVYMNGSIILRKIMLKSWPPNTYKLNEADRKKYKVMVEY